MARILHVEDDEVWIEIVRENLLDHQVDSARSQPEAVKLISSGVLYDAALVDLELGNRGRAGGEILDLLRYRYPGIRRIVLTGRVPGGALYAGVFRRYEVEEVLVKQQFEVPDL